MRTRKIRAVMESSTTSARRDDAAALVTGGTSGAAAGAGGGAAGGGASDCRGSSRSGATLMLSSVGSSGASVVSAETVKGDGSSSDSLEATGATSVAGAGASPGVASTTGAGATASSGGIGAGTLSGVGTVSRVGERRARGTPGVVAGTITGDDSTRVSLKAVAIAGGASGASSTPGSATQ
jgi:hypothetical protein